MCECRRYCCNDREEAAGQSAVPGDLGEGLTSRASLVSLRFASPSTLKLTSFLPYSLFSSTLSSVLDCPTVRGLRSTQPNDLNGALSPARSMFGLFGGGAPTQGADPALVSPAELNEIHRKWKELQQKHTSGLESLLGRLVEENDGLKAKLRSTEDELRLFKVGPSRSRREDSTDPFEPEAGRKEDHSELNKLRKEVQGLRGGDIVSLRVTSGEALS